MRIPKETILAFTAASVGAALVDAGAVYAATGKQGMTPKQLALATASVGIVTSASVGLLGLAMGGWSRPDSTPRGLAWAGALGLIGCLATIAHHKLPAPTKA